jgi:hydrogenase maturation protease
LKTPPARLLIFGYGNPARGDDALGPLLLERVENRKLSDSDCLSDFQLQVEHALDLVDRELVLFIDAHVSCPVPFEFRQIHARRDASYSSHAMTPDAVLEAYLQLFHTEPPPCFVLSVRGTSFELGEPLSNDAQSNLTAAWKFLVSLCQEPREDYWLDLANCAESTGQPSL